MTCTDDEGCLIDLIVLGLPYESEEQHIRDYFTSAYGPLSMAQVKRTPDGSSRGYGFIRFAVYSSQVKCLSKISHMINGRCCEVKIPNSKQNQLQHQLDADLSRKVFIGQITEFLTEQAIAEFFLGRGLPIRTVRIPRPFRNFAFATFADAATAGSLVGRDLVINGVSVNVAAAQPRQQQQQQLQCHMLQHGYSVPADTAAIVYPHHHHHHPQQLYQHQQHQQYQLWCASSQYAQYQLQQPMMQHHHQLQQYPYQQLQQ